VARPIWVVDTSAAVWALMVDQSRPVAAAVTRREPIATLYSLVVAVTTAARAATNRAPAITTGRGTRAMARTSGKLATTTVSAHAETSRPARGRDTPRPAASCGGTAVGIISPLTITNPARAAVLTASHRRRTGPPA